MDGSDIGEADVCTVHAPSHAAAPPLHMLQMILAGLNQSSSQQQTSALRLGPLDEYYATNGWVVTHLANATVSYRLTQLVTEESRTPYYLQDPKPSSGAAKVSVSKVPAARRSAKSKHKTVLAAPPKPAHYNKQLLLTPSTQVFFKFSSYRLVLCLDASASTFMMQDKEGVVFFLLLECLLHTLAHVHQRLCSEADDSYGIKTAFVSVTSHRPETNETFAVWTGALSRDTSLGALQSSVRSRLERLVEEVNSGGALLVPSEAPALQAGPQRQPVADSYLRGALFHLKLLPEAAAPAVILFTNAAMQVAFSSATALLNREVRCALHVVVAECSQGVAPPGFRTDAATLCALAAASPGGGSSCFVRSRKDVEAQMRAHFQSVDVLRYSPLCCSSSPSAVLRSYIPEPLQLQLTSYSVEGCPLEHLLCLRMTGGFVVTAVAHTDALSASETLPNRASSRGASLSITLQKFVTKVQVLVYEVICRPQRRGQLTRRGGGYGLAGLISSSAAVLRQLQSRRVESAADFISLARRADMDGAELDDLQGGDGALAWSSARLCVTLSVLCDALAVHSAAAGAAFRSERAAAAVKTACDDIIDADRRAELLLGLVGITGGTAIGGALPAGKRALARTGERPQGFSSQASAIAELEETAELLAASDDSLRLQLLLSQSYSLVGGLSSSGGEGPPGVRARTLSSRPKVRAQLLGALAQELPDAEVAELSPSRLLILCGGRQRRTGAQLSPESAPASIAGALLVDFIESGNVFLSIRIGRLAGAVGALSGCSLRVARVVLEVLSSRGPPPQLCTNQGGGELPLLSLLPSQAWRRAARACMQGARAQAPRAFLTEDRPQLMWALLAEIVDAKCSLGFQLADASIGGAGAELCAHLTAASSSNPSGIDAPSLLQCVVTVSLDVLSTEYFWQKGCNEMQYERGLALLSHSAERASARIEALVSALTAQDKQIFRLYEIVDSVSSGRGGRLLSLSSDDLRLLEEVMSVEPLYLPCIECSVAGSDLNESLSSALAEAQSARSQASRVQLVSPRDDDADRHYILQVVCGALVLVEIPSGGSQGAGADEEKGCEEEEKGDELCYFLDACIRACPLPARAFSSDLALREAAALVLGGSGGAAGGPSSAAAAAARAAVRINLLDDCSTCLARLVHRALCGGAAPVPAGSIALATSRCLQREISIDMSAMLRRRGLSRGVAAAADSYARLAASVQTSFDRTLGARLHCSPSGGGAYTAESRGDPSEIAFARLSIVCKQSDDLSSALVFPLRSSVRGFAQSLVDVCASIHSIIESSEVLLSMIYLEAPMGAADRPSTAAVERVAAVADASLASQLHSLLREFVAWETLLALQASPGVAATESLLLAHDLLQSDCPEAGRLELSLIVLSSAQFSAGPGQSTGPRSRPGEPAALLEGELLASCRDMRRGGGDLLYARSWSDGSGGAAEPVWILVSLSSQPQAAGAPATVVRASVLLVRLLPGGPAGIEQGLRSMLEQCCHTVNQHSLLQDLYATRLASPYLLAPTAGVSSGEAVPAKPNASRAVPRARLPIPTPMPFAKSSRAAGPQGSPTKAVTEKKQVVPRADEGAEAAAEPPLFKYGHFQCARQGEIVISNYAHGSIPCEAVARHLETSALAQLAVQNRERLFVFQDAQKRVFYMAFEEPQAGGRSLCLGVFGIAPIDDAMRAQMQALLYHRLTEVTAKTISAALARKSSVSSLHLAFLRDGERAGPRPSSLLFALPDFVEDVYCFCLAARQVMLASTALGRLVVAGEEKSKRRDGGWPSASEVTHVSSMGYDLSSAVGAAARPCGGFTRSSSHEMLPLVRKAHVEEEAVFPFNPHLVTPVFFGAPRSYARRRPAAAGSLVAWHQHDFSLLYNCIGPSPAHATAAHRGLIKQVGQGLALLEISPVFAGDRLLSTGARTEGCVASDLQQLSAMLSEPQEQRLCLQQLLEGEQPAGGGSRLVLRVYPTVPMQTHALLDFCAACLSQALGLYCAERLFGCGSAEGEWSWEAARPVLQQVMAMLERPYPSSRAPAAAALAPLVCGSSRVRHNLPPEAAESALRRAVRRLLDAHPPLEETLLSTELCAVVGDFRPTAGGPAAGGAMADYRLLPEAADAIDPRGSPWLRARRFALELALQAEDIVVTHLNTASSLVACAVAAVEEEVQAAALQLSQKAQQQEAQQASLEQGEQQPENQGGREWLLEECVSRLVWERRIERRLMGPPDSAVPPLDGGGCCLDAIPKEAWRGGAAHSSTLLALPPCAGGPSRAQHLLEYALALQKLCGECNCEFIGGDSASDEVRVSPRTEVLLVGCVPRSALVSVTEVRLLQGSEATLELTHSVCAVERLLQLEQAPLSEQQRAEAETAAEHPAVRLWRQRVLVETLIYCVRQVRSDIPAPPGLLQQCRQALQSLQGPLDGQLLSISAHASAPLPLTAIARQWLRAGELPLCTEEEEEGNLSCQLCLPFRLAAHAALGCQIAGLCFISSCAEGGVELTTVLCDAALLRGAASGYCEVPFAGTGAEEEDGALLAACSRSLLRYVGSSLAATSAQLSALRSWSAVFDSSTEHSPDDLRSLMQSCEYCPPSGALSDDAQSLLTTVCEQPLLLDSLRAALRASYGRNFLHFSPADCVSLDDDLEVGHSRHSCCSSATHLLVSGGGGFAVLLNLCSTHRFSARVVHDRSPSSAAAAEGRAMVLLSDLANLTAHTLMQQI